MSSDEERRRSSVDSADMEALGKGITTRVLADRLRTLMSQSSDESSSGSSTPGNSKRNSSDSERRRSSLDGKARRPSKFLTGTSIPNSVIKSNLNAKDPVQKDRQTLRRERDARVSEIIESVFPKNDKRQDSYDETRDLEALAKIRKELQKRSSVIHAGHTRRNLLSEEEEETDNSSPTSSSEETVKKEKRRASCRIESFAPLSCNRTPTFESVKKAVENADLSTVLINADGIPQRTPAKKTTSPQDASTASLVMHQPTSSFITRRKFVSKLEKKKGAGKAKETSVEVLQPGINRPSVLLQKSDDFDDEDEVTILKYPVRSDANKSNSSQLT